MDRVSRDLSKDVKVGLVITGLLMKYLSRSLANNTICGELLIKTVMYLIFSFNVVETGRPLSDSFDVYSKDNARNPDE